MPFQALRGETRMKKKGYKRVVALLLGCIMAFSPWQAGHTGLSGMVSMASERTASVNATNLNVRSGPGTSYQAVAKLSHGAAVTVIGEQTGTDGKLWYQIRFSGGGGAETIGYASSDYIKFPTVITSDGDFESYMNSQGFPESYKPGLRELHAMYPKWTFTALQTNLDWNTAVENESVIGRNLVGRENISSWKSTATGAYDWDTGSWPGFDGNSWVQASEDIIRYYMDPRNFLNEKYIFQFMKQSYDSSIHTREGLESMVAGTFLSGSAGGGTAPSGGSPSGGSSGSGSSGGGPGSGPGSGPGAESGSGPGGSSGSGDNGQAISPISPLASISDHQVERVMTAYGPGMGGGSGFSDSGGNPGNSGGTAPVSGSSSYVDIIMNAAAQSGVNPYILASMIIQEQGSQGTGRSISGTVSGYQGYYNFFNIEAYQSGSMGAVERGLWWASQSGSYERPWNSVEKSILGGSIYYGNNYVKRGQDTLYLKKFNVQGDNLYKHQYMTNVLAAAAEGLTLAKISALKTTALEFSIPVYKNMPATACAKPTIDGSPNNKLSGLGVEGFALTPTFNRDTESYDLIVDHSVSSVTVAASVIDSKSTVNGTGNINLQSGINDITVAVKAQNGSIRNYVIHVVRQDNGPTYSDSIGSGVNSGSGGGSGYGPGGGPGTGPGGGTVSNPGGSSSGNPGGGSDVQIIAPDGSGSGIESGNTNGPMAPGSNVSGFGTSSDPSNLVGPGGSSGTPGPTSGTTPGSTPGGSGSSGTGSGGTQTVSAGVTAAQLAASLTTAGAGSIVKVYNSSGGEVTGGVGTGDLVQAFGSDGSPTVRYDVIVKGDNNGDGKLNILDVLKAQRHILGLETLTGPFEKATDVNGNGKVDIMDILAMQKDILGSQKLN